MGANAIALDQSEPAPRVFIGSSSAALGLARDIGVELVKGGEIEVQVWDEGILQSGDILLDGLLGFVNLFDFAVLVLSADDLTTSKGKRTESPRDNVVFELGMFMGVLGRRRAFPIIAFGETGDLKLPSDLDGFLSTRFQGAKLKDPAYLAEEIGKVRKEIVKRSKESPLSLLPSTGLAHGYFYNFLVPVNNRLTELKTIKVGDKEFDISKGNYDFTILFPRLASQANIDSRTSYVKKEGLVSVVVAKDEHPPRTYGFFAYPDIDPQGKVHFADYPTTLRSSYDAIGLVLKPGALGERQDEQRLMEAKEVRNFIKGLKHLLNKPEAGGFSELIKFKEI